VLKKLADRAITHGMYRKSLVSDDPDLRKI
jgi:hypothetical protein